MRSLSDSRIQSERKFWRPIYLAAATVYLNATRSHRPASLFFPSSFLQLKGQHALLEILFFSPEQECHASDGDFSSCLATTTAFPKSICLVLLTKKKCCTEDTGGFWCSACSLIPAETSSDHLRRLLKSEIYHISSPTCVH